MQSFLLLLLGLATLGACIWFLHRTQLRRTVENADLRAPLDALDNPLGNDVESPTGAEPVPAPEPVLVVVSEPLTVAVEAPGAPAAVADTAPAINDSWLARIRGLRDSGDLGAALTLSRGQFPKTQAFQQAAIILRQQIRETLDRFQPADALLLELYHTAALADLFRTSNSHKPHNPQAALAAVRSHTGQYAALGHLRLKLLNKSDVRALEQLWGAPTAHRHTEDLLGEDWLLLCRAP
jgi:hypothetical protein